MFYTMHLLTAWFAIFYSIQSDQTGCFDDAPSTSSKVPLKDS